MQLFHAMFKFSKQKGGVQTSIRRVTILVSSPFFNFLAADFFFYFLLFCITLQINMQNTFPLPIISYKSLFLVFLCNFDFPFYNYISKRYFVVLFVTRKNYIYEKFFKNKEKSWPALSQRKSAYIWNFSAKQILIV